MPASLASPAPSPSSPLRGPRRAAGRARRLPSRARRGGVALGILLGVLVVAAPATAPASENPEAEATAPYWIHFVDKGLDSRETERVAIERARDALTPRCLERRAKARGTATVDLLDVPVHEPYVTRVLAAGVELRTRSRWLNAISVDATPERAEAVEALPFVAAVRPVARTRRDPVEVAPVTPSPRPSPPPARSVLDYGECASQIVPIQVDQLHDQGYSGAGVLVTLMDTGFLRTHDALVGVDVMAERDFVNGDGNTANEGSDDPNQHNHGTMVLSSIGGWDPGTLIGPAYGATYLLAKTEDITSETPVEEDYWVAAAEWGDSLGADVFSTSLTYYDWYDFADMDGNTATITIAADLAVANGIAVFNSAGNYRANEWGHIAAPADGDSVITVGAVDSTGVVTWFSSPGPTADGRIKPDVCAMGEDVLVGVAWDDHGYVRADGTSFSCPITAGVGALLLEVHPTWTPMHVREALRSTATHAASPDNDYGWGVIRAADAAGYSTTAPSFGPPSPSETAMRVSPNPSTGAAVLRYSLAAGAEGRARLAIYDVGGRLVRDLGRVRADGKGELAWDGRDDAGRRVPSGLYFARLEGGRGKATARIVRIR
jgi:subtilisin family serine protease